MAGNQSKNQDHNPNGSTGNRLTQIIEKNWVVALFRIIFSANTLALGAFIAVDGLNEYSLAWLFASMLFFGLFEFLFHKTIEYVKEETKKSTLDSIHKTATKEKELLLDYEFNMSLFSMTSNFLSLQLQRTIRTINELLKISETDLRPSKELIMKKDRIITDTLKQMCVSFITIAGQKYHIHMSDVMFRATYMIVQKDGNDEKLVYYAWHTPGGHPPRSKSEGTEYKKKEGVAGLAWDRERVVIEDKFKDDKEWRDNYKGQGKLYKSMACIPAFDCTINGKDNVIGVITIDTNIKGFFGRKDSKDMEGRIANWIRPYADNVSFVTAMDSLISEGFPKIDPEPQ